MEQIGEPSGNVLRLVVAETFVRAEAESRNIAGVIFEGLHRIEPTENSRRFELIWDSYIAYSVTNESFGSTQGPGSLDSGRHLRHYTESPFLTFVRCSTIATHEYPGPYIHLQLLTESHIVDVVSENSPLMRLRGAAEA